MKLRHLAAASFACFLFADVGPPGSGPGGCDCDDEDAAAEVVICAGEQNCAAGQVCCLGTCKKSCPGRTCSDDTDCAPEDFCDQGACKPVPTNDSDPSG